MPFEALREAHHAVLAPPFAWLAEQSHSEDPNWDRADKTCTPQTRHAAIS